MAPQARADVVIDSTHFTVGAIAGGNTVNSNWVGTAFSITAPILVGSAAGGATGFGNNTVTTSNFLVTANAASYVGNGSSNNVVTLLTNTTWNLANNILNIGMGAATGNVVNLEGGVISNAGGLRISGNVNSSYNSLIVTNGGRFVMTTAAPITIGGGNTAGAIGGGNNTVILSNSVLLGFNPSSWSIIGYGSSNNTVSLLANTTWNNSNQELDFGWGTAANNRLNVNGAILTNFGGLYIGAIAGGAFSNSVNISNGGQFLSSFTLVVGGAVGANYNSLIVTNGGRFVQTAGAANIGGGFGGAIGGNNNTVILSNSQITLSGAFTFGQNSSSNILTLLPNTVWNNNNGATLGLAVGYNTAGNSSYGNVMTVSGAIISNLGPLTVGGNFILGGSASVSNQLIVNNDGIVSNVTGMIVGGAPGGNYNRLIVTNGGFFMTSAGSIGVGASTAASQAGGSYNTVILSNSVLLGGGASSWSIMGFNSSNNTFTLLQNSTWNNGNQDLYVGWQTSTSSADSNVLTITGATVSNVSQLLLGRNSKAVSNSVVINAGGRLFVGSTGVTIGNSAGGNNNSLIISNGGMLDVNSLVISGGTGNTVSNSGGIFQFSQVTPTITSITRGDIAITNGTISFRGVATADVNGNQGVGTSLRNIVFSGVNTFMLNGASNNTSSQNYNFQAVTGNPSNYVNLALVNGQTAYRGGNLTIGSTGSLLISNTTASISGGVFSNAGIVQVANASTLNSSADWTSTGTITNRGGTIAGGVLTNQGLLIGAGTNSSRLLNLAGGTLVATNGTLGLTGGVTNGGFIQVSAGGTLNVATDWANNNTITNRGTIAGGILTNTGTLIGNGSLNSRLVNNNLLIVTNGTLTLTSSLLQNGFVTVAGGASQGTLDVVSAWANAGTLTNLGGAITGGNLTNTGLIIGSGAIDSAAVFNGGTILADTASPLRFGGTMFVNQSSGILTADNSSVTVNGSFTNSGGLALIASTATFNSLVVRNLGSLVLNASTLTAGNAIITNTATGVIYLNGGAIVDDDLVNQGHIITTGGLISNALINTAGAYIDIVSGVLTGTPDLVNFGIITNNATLQIGSSGSGTVTNSGTIVLNDGALLSGQITNTGTITGTGTLTGPTLNSGLVSATNGELRLLGKASGTGAYRAVVGANDSTLTFASGGSISALFNTGSTIRVEGLLTNTLSTFVNAGTLAIINSTYVNSGRLQNITNGIITASNARLVVNGTFTNQSGATLTMLNSVGTFNAVVVNSGAWITDPTTNVFNGDHIVTASGYISAGAGDVYQFRSNFVNQSTQTTSYDTFNTTPGGSGLAGTKFVFDGTNTVSSTGYTQNFFTAGLHLTGGFVGIPTPLATGVQTVSTFAAVIGLVDNFALDRLELGNAGTNSLLQISSTFGLSNSGNTNALFVNDLWIFGNSQLIISNNTMVYFVNSNNWTAANYQLLGNAQLHQLVVVNNVAAVVPEPSVALLWLAGIGTLYASRRRQSKRVPYQARL